MKPKDLPLFQNRNARQVLEAACKQNGLTLELLQQLLDAQRKYAGSGRAMGITADYESCIADFLETKTESGAK